MLPTSENLCWRSSSRCRTRLDSLRSWVRSRSTSLRDADGGGDGNWWWRGDDDVSAGLPDDSLSPEPGVSAPADGSTPLELWPAVCHAVSSPCRCPDSPSSVSFCNTAIRSFSAWTSSRNAFKCACRNEVETLMRKKQTQLSTENPSILMRIPRADTSSTIISRALSSPGLLAR